MRAERPVGGRRRGGALRILSLLAVLAVALTVVVPRGSYGVLPIAAAVAAYQPTAVPAFPTSAARTDAASSSREEAPAAAAHSFSLSWPWVLGLWAPSWAPSRMPSNEHRIPSDTFKPVVERLYQQLRVLRN